ncbi:threonine aldolase family protein [Leucobacter sp. GX24907]
MTDALPHETSRPPRDFGSDNWAGAHPEVIEAISRANGGHTPSYGDDPWTRRFEEVVREHFGSDARAFPVLNGTGANVLALHAALPRWGAVICADTAHINDDETGAPEKTGGLKLLPIESADGKLTPELVERQAWGHERIHRATPLAVSISQTTEWGTRYSPAEIRALADHAHERGMILHMDGSRLGNAAAGLNVPLAALTTDAGVDLLSLGGTKNGLLGAEAIVVLGSRPDGGTRGATTGPAGTAGAASAADLVPGIEYLRKTVLQLGSKMRFVSAQLTALYEGDLWQRSAAHANAMAERLASGIEELSTSGRAPGVSLAQRVESNAVFASLPPKVAAHARTRFSFMDWHKGAGVVRLMCAFDTRPEDVDELLALIAEGARGA